MLLKLTLNVIDMLPTSEIALHCVSSCVTSIWKSFQIMMQYLYIWYITCYHDLPLITTYDYLSLVSTHDDMMCHKSYMIIYDQPCFFHIQPHMRYDRMPPASSRTMMTFARQRCGGFCCPPSWCCLLDQFWVASLASFGLMGKWHRHWNHMISCS